MTPGIINSPSAAAAVAAPAASRRWQIDVRFVAPILITFILLVGQLSFGILESYQKTLLAICCSLLAEVVLSRVMYGKWPHLASAYVSGISVGILVRSPFFWPYALCAVISIMSKYVIRAKGRHLWNPSNFGIVALLALAPQAVTSLSVQWGNTLWPMLVVWTLGSVIVYRLKRFHICATYVLSFVLFAALRSAMTGQAFAAEVAPITGPMYQLFIFFMITDPKSTVLTFRGQIAVAFSIALVECILRMNHNIHAPYFALFLVGPLANGLEIWRTKRTKSGPQSAELSGQRAGA